MSDLIIEVNPHASFASKDQRQRFIAFVAGMLAVGRFGRPFEPYQLNPDSSDLEWVVDEHNDWWVFFDDENPLRVRIRQRYDVPELSTLGAWIAYRMRATVVTPAVKPM